MPHLTFADATGNIPIAIIEGGRKHGKIVYVSDKAESTPIPSRVDYANITRGAGNSRTRAKIEARLEEAIRHPSPGVVEADLQPFLERVIAERGTGREIDVPDGTVRPLPNPNEDRDTIYAYGASGSGKSTAIANHVKRWLKLYPDGKVFMWSRLGEVPPEAKDEDAFDGIPMKRININDALGEAHLGCEDFPLFSYHVFDDIDSLPKKQMEAVQEVMHDLLKRGRHFRQWVAVTNHLGSDYNRTRGILNDTQMIIAFPYGSSAKANKYVLTEYGGMSNIDVDKALMLPTRWIAVRRPYPPLLMHEHGIYLLGGLDKKDSE